MNDRISRNLLTAFVLGVLLCAVLCFADISLLLFATVVPFFCLQLALLRWTKRLLLRLIPVYPIALMLAVAGYYWGFGTGWDQLITVIFGFASIAPAVGCLAAWIIHRFSGRLLTRKWLAAALVLLGCAGAWMGQELCLDYWDRAFVKALSFGCCMGLYLLITRDRALLSIFRRPDRTSLKMAAVLAAGVFLFLTAGYALLSPWLDLSAIPGQLRLSDITTDNFPLVALYITLCNSLLEELFFRGFAFLALKRHGGTRFAYGFSGIAFAVYHVSIMANWFHPIWFGLFIAGLAIGGMFFDWLDRRGTIWPAWLVHMAANLAINLIGMRMFGIL